MIIIALIILNFTERGDGMAAWLAAEDRENQLQGKITQSFIQHSARPSLLCCISTETNGLLGRGYSHWWDTRDGNGSGARVGGNQGKERGSVACGEYVMVPPGLVTAMCVFPFISSETCHIMGLNTGYINSGIETKQAQWLWRLYDRCGYAFRCWLN